MKKFIFIFSMVLNTLLSGLLSFVFLVRSGCYHSILIGSWWPLWLLAILLCGTAYMSAANWLLDECDCEEHHAAVACRERNMGRYFWPLMALGLMPSVFISIGVALFPSRPGLATTVYFVGAVLAFPSSCWACRLLSAGTSGQNLELRP